MDKVLEKIRILDHALSIGLNSKSLIKASEEDINNLFLVNKKIDPFFKIKFLKSQKIVDVLNSDDEELKQKYYELCSFKNIKIETIEWVSQNLINKFWALKNRHMNGYSFEEIVINVLKFSIENNLTEEKSIILFENLCCFASTGGTPLDLEIKEILSFISKISYKLDRHDDRFVLDALKVLLMNRKIDNANLLIYLINNKINFSDLNISYGYFDKMVINDYELLITKLTKILEEVKNKEVFINLIKNTEFDFSIKNLDRIIYLLKKNKIKKPMTRKEFLKFFYPDDINAQMLLKTDSHIKRNFVIYLLNNKKRAFVSLLVKNINMFLSIDGSNTLFNENFYKVVNVNSLTQKDLNFLSLEKLWLLRLPNNIQLTFNEYKTLASTKTISASGMMMEIYLGLMDVSIDKRIRLFKEIIPFENYLTSLKKEEATKISSMLKEESFSSRFQKAKKNIKNLTKKDFLRFLITDPLSNLFNETEKAEKVKNQIKNRSDLDFLFKLYKDKYKTVSSDLKMIKRNYYDESGLKNKVIQLFGFKKEFLKLYEENIFNMLDQGIFDVILSLLRDNKLTTSQKINLKFLTKAYIAGQYDKIKFCDLDKELEMIVQNNMKNIWKKNYSSSINSIFCTETYDFETLLRIGEKPVSTCLHWETGSYRDCLLANFDASKKIMAAYKNDEIVARAVLRLTKYATKIDSTLSFKDVEKMEIDEDNSNKEKIVLFLEKSYTHLDTDQRDLTKAEFLKILLKKAADMGAVLVVSTNYDSIIEKMFPNLKKEKCKLFIPRSKNRAQYIDSFPGRVSASQASSMENYFFAIDTKRGQLD